MWGLYDVDDEVGVIFVGFFGGGNGGFDGGFEFLVVCGGDFW